MYCVNFSDIKLKSSMLISAEGRYLTDNECEQKIQLDFSWEKKDLYYAGTEKVEEGHFYNRGTKLI